MGWSPIPADLQKYFTVSGMEVRLHGRSRKPKKPHHMAHHGLHGRSRSTATHNPDPWRNKGVARGGRH